MNSVLHLVCRSSPALNLSRLGIASLIAPVLLVSLAMSWPMCAMAEDANAAKVVDGETSTAEGSLDWKAILAHNRAWLQPEFAQLKSVSFRYVTGPKQLAESFDWRADGLSLLEVLESPDWKSGAGRREMTMPDGAFYFYAPESRYPQPKASPAGETERHFREHLRGTRMNCATLDWGVEPERFVVRKVSPKDDGTQTATLVPQKTPYRINVGVMFHTVSWAYVHDLDIASAELTIDPATRRVLREVDFSAEGERLAKIEFCDWKEVAADREVPLEVHVQIQGKSSFDMDYRFQWCSEGLWILKSSTGTFDRKEPQRGDILDLAINQATPRLDRAAECFAQSVASLQEPASASERITLRGLCPFEVGKTVPLQDAASGQFPTARNVLFSFDLDDPSSKYNHSVELVAEFDLERFDASKMADSQLLLTFLDQHGLPIQEHYGSLAPVPMSEQSVTTTVENLCKHNRLWLAPASKDSYSYLFRKDSTTKRVSVDEHSALTDRQGFTLFTSFQDLLRSPEEYRIPVQFEGLLDGNAVVFAGFCGKTLNCECGNGLSGVGWHGYMSFLNSTGLVLFEKSTSRPLVVRVGHLEIQYRDYVEIEPGVSAPLRIVVIADNESQMSFDLRFKVLEGRLWLFDRAYHEGKVVTWTEDVLWSDGTAAVSTMQSTEESVPLEELKPFDFRRVTDRCPVDSGESAILGRIITQSEPWKCPGYADLMKTFLSAERPDGTSRLRMNLGPAVQLKDASFFTLTWLSPEGESATVPGPNERNVCAFLWLPGELSKMKLFSGSVASAWGLLSAEIKKEKASYEAKVEFVDATQDKGLAATLSLAIVDPQGTILSAGHRNVHFINYQGVYSSEQVLHLNRVEDTQPLYLMPRYHTEITAERMGSSLRTSYDRYRPPLAWNLILSAEDSRVWGYGLQLLQENVNHTLHRYAQWDFPLDALENGLRDRVLSPHRDNLARLLRTTTEPKWLAILAQLAGHTDDPQFCELLLPLLEHPEREVREAAAIHLCRLREPRGLKLALEAFQQELHNVPESTGRSLITPRLVEAFMALHIIDTDEVISTLGKTFLEWLRRPLGDQRIVHGAENGTQAAFVLMLGCLGHSEHPQAVGYLCRALRQETRSNVQDAILTQLHRHENNDEVCRTIIAGLEEGSIKYFGRAPHRPDIVETVAKKLLDPELKVDVFSVAVSYLTYDKGAPAHDALQQAYEKKLHADDPELRSAVICGLARHNDNEHLPEVFDLLVKVVEQPLSPSADKKEEFKRKTRIDHIAGGATGIARHFPPDVVAEFLHTKDTETQPAVQVAIQILLDASREIAAAYKKTRLPKSGDQP